MFEGDGRVEPDDRVIAGKEGAAGFVVYYGKSDHIIQSTHTLEHVDHRVDTTMRVNGDFHHVW
ncbi:hypothetical protein D3C75_1095020 [compost metagenome]